MSDLIFIQRGRLPRSLFVLSHDFVDVSVGRFPRKVAARIELRRLSTDYERQSKREHILYVLPLVGALLSVGLSIALLRQHSLPHNFVIWTGTGVAVFGWAAVRGWPRIEYFLFYDQWKRPALVIFREASQGAECDEFVRALLDRIERAATEEIPVPSDTPALEVQSAVRIGSLSPSSGADGQKWLWSLASAASSLLLPLPQLVFPAWAWVSIPAVVLGCMGALLFGIYSFLGKEPRRWWSLAAMLASLVPPLFY